jgi:hypothetical protein
MCLCGVDSGNFMFTEHDAGIVMSAHGPLLKYFTYLDNFILEIHINICDLGSVFTYIIT